MLVAQSYLTLCDPMNCSPSDSSVHGILQVGILGWVAISFSRGSSWPRDGTWISCISGRLFTIWATKEAGFTKKSKLIILPMNKVRPLLRVMWFQFNWFKIYIPVFPHEPCCGVASLGRAQEKIKDSIWEMLAARAVYCHLPVSAVCTTQSGILEQEHPLFICSTWWNCLYVHIFGEIPLLFEWVSFSVQQSQDFI